jgi:hypothetical protein
MADFELNSLTAIAKADSASVEQAAPESESVQVKRELKGQWICKNG